MNTKVEWDNELTCTHQFKLMTVKNCCATSKSFQSRTITFSLKSYLLPWQFWQPYLSRPHAAWLSDDDPFLPADFL